MIDTFATEKDIRTYFGSSDHPEITSEFQKLWEGLSWNQRYNFKFNVWEKLTKEERSRWSAEWAGLNKQARKMFVQTRLGTVI